MSPLLSGGRIAAVGTHHELLRTNAEYAWLMAGADEETDRGDTPHGTDSFEEAAR